MKFGGIGFGLANWARRAGPVRIFLDCCEVVSEGVVELSERGMMGSGAIWSSIILMAVWLFFALQ